MVGPAPSPPALEEPVWHELARFIRFGAEDQALLQGARELVRPHFAAIATRFYERIREHERAHAVLADEDQVSRLHRSLIAWLERVFTGPWDAAYYEATSRIGKVHVQVGLPLRYTLGGMTLVRSELQRLVGVARGDAAPATAETEGPSPTAIAIDKVLDLELATMQEAHFEHQFERIRHYDAALRAEAEGRHAEREALWASAVELARLLFIAIDAHGRISLFNPEAERATGYGRDEAVGKAFVQTLIPPEHRAEVQGALAATLGGAQPVLEHSAVRTRAGRVREVRWQFAGPPQGTAGESVFAIGQDTTLETSLATRLRQSERLAAIGTLAAGLAHEIRNPLNGATLHLTVLERALRKREDAGGDLVETVTTVRAEIRRLGDLVTEFLEFARPFPLDLQPDDLREVCRQCAHDMAQSAADASSTIELDLSTSPVELSFDRARIEEALRNLLFNALEAMAPIGGVARLRLRREPRSAVIEVEDEGRGIEDPAAPVFDPFYTTKPSGTGLGLSVAHRVAMDHGGSISFRSRPGRTVFRLELPIEVQVDSRRVPPAGRST